MVHENYDKAIEHFENGFSLVDDDYELANTFREKLPLHMFDKMLTEIKELKKLLQEVKMF